MGEPARGGAGALGATPDEVVASAVRRDSLCISLSRQEAEASCLSRRLVVAGARGRWFAAARFSRRALSRAGIWPGFVIGIFPAVLGAVLFLLAEAALAEPLSSVLIG